MIAVDTNILLRLTLVDDQEQLDRSVSFIEEAQADRNVVFINPIVLAEYVWTLARIYRASRQEQASAVRQYIDRPPYRLFDDSIVMEALDLFDASKADFADCLIGAINSASSAEVTYSFDQAASVLPAFALAPKLMRQRA